MNATATWDDWSCRVRVTVTRPQALPAAKQHLVALMAEVALAADRFSPHSGLSRINDGAGRLVPVSRRTVELVDVALEAARRSDGTVDPTVGAHLVAAGYDRDIADLRDRHVTPTVVEGAPLPTWTAVQVDHTLLRVGVPTGMALDLGATAKAWTVDTAARTIARACGTAVLVEIGGDLAVSGDVTTPWQVTVAERPSSLGGRAAQRLGLVHGGLATSTTTARRWRTPAGDAHHVIDPRTGRPADGPWRTATVWAATALQANTASTAAIVLGDAAVDVLERQHVAARLVDHGGRVHTVGDWPSDAEAA